MWRLFRPGSLVCGQPAALALWSRRGAGLCVSVRVSERASERASGPNRRAINIRLCPAKQSAPPRAWRRDRKSWWRLLLLLCLLARILFGSMQIRRTQTFADCPPSFFCVSAPFCHQRARLHSLAALQAPVSSLPHSAAESGPSGRQQARSKMPPPSGGSRGRPEVGQLAMFWAFSPEAEAEVEAETAQRVRAAITCSLIDRPINQAGRKGGAPLA